MNRIFEGIIVTAVILFALWVCGWMVYEGISETNKNREYVGEKIVWQDDTLTITGYNASYGHYILNNGLLMDKSYVHARTLQIKPNKAQIDSTLVRDKYIMKPQIDTNDTRRISRIYEDISRRNVNDN